MRVCDKHNDVRAVEQIKFSETDESVDLCKKCSDAIHDFIGNPKKRKVEEPRKRRLLTLGS